MVLFYEISLIFSLLFMLKIGQKKRDFCVMRQICQIFINNNGINIVFQPPF